MSRSTASEMGLVKFINNIKEYPKVNCEPVKIKIKEGARPYATPVARVVPIPLMQRSGVKKNEGNWGDRRNQ